jgi:hypothetical protein
MNYLEKCLIVLELKNLKNNGQSCMKIFLKHKIIFMSFTCCTLNKENINKKEKCLLNNIDTIGCWYGE